MMGKRYYSFVGIYTFTYAAIGMLLPLLGQYLAGIGFSGVQIGVVTATGTAIGIGASPFWGYRSHHSKDSTRVVIFLCIIATLILIGLLFVKQYVIFLLVYAAFAFFQTPIMPLTDAMALEGRIPFGAVRKWGAIGFAGGVFIAGQLAEATSLLIIFPLCAFGYTVAWFIMVRLRRGKIKELESLDKLKTEESADLIESRAEQAVGNFNKEHRGDYRTLLRNKKLMALLFAAFFICGTNVANNTYFGFLYKDVGGSIAGIGVAFLLMCGGEAPFMAWADRLSSKFTMEKLILFSMIISALRYLWYSTGPAPELLIGTFFLQGLVNGIVLVELVRYVAKLVEPAMIGMAMTLYQAISSNCSSILCQLIGGAILDHYSGIQVYLFFSIYNAIGILLYVGFRLYKCS
ncbi:MAG TPA: MFS transporter [Anaerovoracaceae bacterium]|nr:MFS transporter [Anaerovoracaceae bacterium]